MTFIQFLLKYWTNDDMSVIASSHLFYLFFDKDILIKKDKQWSRMLVKWNGGFFTELHPFEGNACEIGFWVLHTKTIGLPLGQSQTFTKLFIQIVNLEKWMDRLIIQNQHKINTIDRCVVIIKRKLRKLIIAARATNLIKGLSRYKG